MMIKKSVLVLVVVSLVMVGCAPYGHGPKEQQGTFIGAASGALLGAQVGSGQGRLVAVAIGTLAGALLGQDVGRTLDKADRMAMQQNAQYALEHAPTNTSTTWRNPDSGNAGALMPVETYQSKSGEYCREYRQTVSIGGQRQEAYGTACRQPDGNWKIIR
jgi:surface antigen